VGGGVKIDQGGPLGIPRKRDFLPEPTAKICVPNRLLFEAMKQSESEKEGGISSRRGSPWKESRGKSPLGKGGRQSQEPHSLLEKQCPQEERTQSLFHARPCRFTRGKRSFKDKGRKPTGKIVG